MLINFYYVTKLLNFITARTQLAFFFTTQKKIVPQFNVTTESHLNLQEWFPLQRFIIQLGKLEANVKNKSLVTLEAFKFFHFTSQS